MAVTLVIVWSPDRQHILAFRRVKNLQRARIVADALYQEYPKEWVMSGLEQELQAKSFEGLLRCQSHNIYGSVWDMFHRPNKRDRLLRICTQCHAPVCRSCRRFIERKPYCLACADSLEGADDE